MRRLISRAFWMSVGAAVQYLLDPVRGRSRRVRLKDQAAARLNTIQDRLMKKLRYQKGRAKGFVHDLAPQAAEMPESDVELLQKVKSEAIGPASGTWSDLEIDVKDGVVYLHGVTDDPNREPDLVRRIAQVDGVRRVHDELVRAGAASRSD